MSGFSRRKSRAEFSSIGYIHCENGLVARFVALIRGLQVQAGLVERSLRIIVGLDSLTIFVHCPIALAGDVEDFAQPLRASR